MLDPLSALGLVSNIVQLLEISGQIVGQTHEFLQSSTDALPSNESLAALAEDNKDLADAISSIIGTQQPLTRYEAAARDAATHCSGEAAELLSELDTLKVKKRSSKLITGMRAVGQSLRTATKRNSLVNRQKNLQAREAQLGTALLQLIFHNQGAKFDELKLWMQSRDVLDGNRLLSLKDEVKQTVEAQQNQLQDNSRLIQDGFAHLEARYDKLDLALNQEDYEWKARLIVESLRFADMDYRRKVIPDSHRKTFEWSFDKNVSQLQSWLEHGDGIFWICGKAGSGKSTFMKFLCNDRRTRKALRTWSSASTLIFVEHYFWYAGT